MSKQKHLKPSEEREVDPNQPLRRHAVWLFPGVFLIHTLIVYGVYPAFVRASLIITLVSLVVGLSIRWATYATTLIAFAVFLVSFMMMYIMGIAAPVALLAISNHREWIPWCALVSSSVLLAILWLRIRVSFRDEWSEPLDKTEGVVLNLDEQTLLRYPSKHQPAYATVLAVVMLVIFVPILMWVRESTTYRLVVFVVAPVGVAILGADFVARGITYYWVVKRWESAHGVRLKVPRRL